jgi:polysaccharide export outer membrane protein
MDRCGSKSMHVKHLIGLIISLVLLIQSSASFSQTPSAAQIEKFKQLPASQQQALAKQYGVDLGALSNSNHPQPTINPLTIDNNRQPIKTADIKQQSEDADVDPLLELDEQELEPLEPFGYQLFENAPTRFMPAIDIPIPSEYVMGPGDNIIVQFYGKENLSHALTINREGEIQFPKLGPIVVAGLSFTDVKRLITNTIDEQMMGVNASITMGALRSIRIFILGDATLPGSYTVNSLSTMTNALFASGGISKMGSLRNIQLKRGGKIITTLDLYRLLLNGDTTNDARLLPGDVIFIPPIGKTVGVSGEVRRPAIYELNKETTAAQVVSLAGGFLGTAYPQASRIERINDNGQRTLVDVDLKTRQGKNLVIKDADTLQVFSVLDTVEGIVEIEGHVKRPGGSAWQAGLHFSDVIANANALLPNADVNVALIVRERDPARQIEVEIVNPSAAFSAPHSEDDPRLNARDRIIIFDYSTDRIEILQEVIDQLSVQASIDQRRQLVYVNGNVRFPGQYPLARNASAKQMIALAGGLTDRAFSLGAELTRYVLDEQQRQSITHFNIDLSNSHEFALQEEDSIHIKQLPNWKGTETVEIEGEVVFPGTYTIQRGETLSQLIERAGGLNEYAFIAASIFSRAELRELERLRLDELQQQLEEDIATSNLQEGADNVAQDEADQLLKSMEDIRPTGRMVINLENIIAQPENYDVALKDGDRLVVPMQRQTVTVVGEVQHATSHVFEDRLSINDYIDRSGGTTMKADKKRIYVVRANGSVYLPGKSHWFKRNDKDIQPGDTVVIPLDADRMKALTLWGSVSEIVYRMALGAAAVASF